MCPVAAPAPSRPGSRRQHSWDNLPDLAALGFPTAKVTDFGIGHVMSAQALAGITATGLTATVGPLPPRPCWAPTRISRQSR